MRIGISSLAWAPADDDWVAEQLLAHGIAFVDLAPSKIFGIEWSPTLADLHRVRSRWESLGLPIVGLQSLFFGTVGLNLFGPEAVRQRMLDHLRRVADMAHELGASRLVFGSPRNRDVGALSAEQALPIATDFFQRAGDLVAVCGLKLCLEPNPPAFGCNFMTDFASTLQIVHAVAHPAVGLNFDVGALLAEGGDATTLLAQAAVHVCHIHLSEPGLQPLGDAGHAHAAVGAALNAAMPHARAAIEVLPSPDSDLREWLPRTLAFAVATYGDKKR